MIKNVKNQYTCLFSTITGTAQWPMAMSGAESKKKLNLTPAAKNRGIGF